ncbi:hypothetical protein [Kitasatospora sp. NPDC093558]|uniref:hypothetical protein n=1 Tax=Kitasatospora sp. NPDC093558 TaxID=3155201 RepID=UPI0034434E09
MKDDAYCKIYVDLESTVQVKNGLQDLLGINFSVTSAEALVGDIPVGIYVMRHKPLHRRQADDFLTWRVTIDIEPDDRSAATDELVITVLEHFWLHSVSAVAACDYEDDLPFQGTRILQRDEPQ